MCLPRYSALAWTWPSEGEVIYASAATVEAELVIASGRSRADPPALSGQLLEMPSATTQTIDLRLVDAGRYTATVQGLTTATHTLTVTWPDAGLMATRQFAVDISPPQFQKVAFEPPPQRRVAGALNELDILVGAYADSGIPFFRRDELPRVAITSSIGTDPASIMLSAALVDLPDGGSTRSYTTLPLRGTTCFPDGCSDAGVCNCFEVDLTAPPLPSRIDLMTLQVSGRRLGGQASAQPAGTVGITRWKWSYLIHPSSDAGFGYATAPLVDSMGNIVVRTNGWECVGGACGALTLAGSLSGGWMRSISPNGSERWLSAVPPAHNFGRPPVASGSNIVLSHVPTFAFDALDGGSRQISCTRPDDAGSPGLSVAPIVLAIDGGVYARTAVSSGDGGIHDIWWTIRPTSNSCSGVVFPHSSPLRGLFAGAAGQGDMVWTELLRPTSGMTNIELTSGTFAPIATAPAAFLFPETTTVATLPANGGFVGLTGPYYQGQGNADSGVVYRSTASGTVTSRFPTSSEFSGSGVGLVVAADGTAIALFNDGSNGQLVSLAPNGAVTTTTLSATYRAPPLLGRGGLLYLPGVSEVSVRPTDGGVPYSIFVPGATTGFITSPTIDCTRSSSGVPVPGRPGVLYVIKSAVNQGPFREAVLYAIIVDSAGIDTTAAWPKYLHDPRNTNNAATDLSEFACP